VSASLDFVRHEKTEERYIPENQVVRSEQLLNQSSNSLESMPMGVPGVGSNMSEEKTEAVAGAKAPGILRQDKTRNYEIGKVVSHQVMPMGGLNRISAAVIVDGTYKAMESREGESVRKYFPRTQEEMQKLENIVMTAINFDANRGDKVEVVNIPFEASKMVADQEGVAEPGWMSQVMAHAPSIRYVFLGLFLLLSFLFIARPLVRWLTSAPAGDLEMLRQLPKTVEEIEREYDAGVKGLPFREKALQVIRGEGENSVELIRDWMKEEKA
jgi:flagellar M-ring protein FliF